MAAKKQAQVIITANASVAERVMQELEGAAQRAANQMKSLASQSTNLKEQMRQLEAAGKKDTDEFKALNEQLRQVEKEYRTAEKEFQAFNSRMRENVKDTKRVQEVMKDLAGTATRDLRRALQSAKRELDKMSAKDPNRQQLINDMKKIQAQIEANTGALKRQQSVFGTLGTTMKNLFAYAGIFAGFNMLKSKMEEAYEANKKFSDSLANVRKVSGLAMEDIKQLANNLSAVDSRTSLGGLMELSYTGAKLGFGNYGIEGLEAFAKSAVKVQNALSEDMGEDSMTALSKLVEVMGLIPKMGVERAMDAAGSAIFKLASTSTATGTNIIEFTKRLMGLANVSHVTTAELLALGSASDSMGLMAEVSATAFNKVFTSIQSNTRGIESALKFTKGELVDMINQGQTMDAIVAVFEKMHGMSMDQLKAQGVFKALGSDGARLNNVMITMANRIDMLKTHLQTSNQAFEEGTAVAQEYAIQMDTAAAYSERAANIWNKAFVNPQGVDTVKEFTKAWYEVSKSMTSNKFVMGEIKFLLIGILEVMKAIVQLLPSIMFGLTAIGGYRLGAAIATGLKPAWEVMKGMTLSLSALRTGFMALSTVARANIFGVAVTAILALGSAISMLNKKVKEASGYMEGFKKDLSGLNLEYAKGEAELSRYRRAIDEANVGTKQRAAAIAQFNNKFKPYLSNLLTEKSTALDVAKAYGEVCKQLRTKLALEMKNKDISEQVMPREAWTAQRREEYDRAAREAGMSQYGSSWITGYAHDNKGKSVDALVKNIGQQYYNLPQKVLDEVAKQAALGAREFNNYGNIINNQYLKKANALLAAGSYLRQDRSTENAMRSVNKKWEPEQKAMDEYLAAQAQEEPITPIDETRLTKEEIADAKKAAQERKQALRKELQDAERESDAIVSKIEEWYRLQEAIVTGYVADGIWTQKQADVVIDQLNMAKNEALGAARLSITGKDTQTWERVKQNIGLLMFDTGEWSAELLDSILNVNLENVRTALGRFDGSAAVEGLTSTAQRDRINKNAAGNIREVERIRRKSAEAVEKMLLQYNYLDQAVKSFDERLTQLGLLSESAAAAAKRIREAEKPQTGPSVPMRANTPKSEEELNAQRSNAKRQAAMQFVNQGAANYGVDINSAESLNKWLWQFSTEKVSDEMGTTFGYKGWAETFREDFEKWLADSETYKSDIQGFYLSLVKFDTDYYKSIKSYRSLMDQEFSERWEASGKGRAYSDVSKQIEIEGRQQKMTGADQGTNFAQMAGFAQIGNDPEVQASLVRMAQMQEELEMYKQVNAEKQMSDAEREAYMQGLHEREQAFQESEMAMREALMANINDQISKMNQWTQPVQQFATDVGTAMGEALASGESFEEGMRNALKSLVQSWGQSTIEIIKNLMMQSLKQKLIGKTMVKQEKQTQGEMTDTDEEGGKDRLNATNIVETGMASVMQTMGNQILATKQTQDNQEMAQEGTKTTGKVMAGIAQMAATILGSLGPFAAPLIAVFTALLMGLLSMALGALGGGKKDSSGAKAATKVKLKSGMLTYDEGNIGAYAKGQMINDKGQSRQYLGNDGNVYRARPTGGIPEGVSLVKSPIATTVNGQPSLVAEKGPEIVIGRKTTQRIMMNEPRLLHHLATLGNGRSYGGYRGLRTFDDGNLEDVLGGRETGRQGVQDNSLDADTKAALKALPTVLAALQGELARGIKSTVNMYGAGGLDESMAKRDAFRRKYNH